MYRFGPLDVSCCSRSLLTHDEERTHQAMSQQDATSAATSEMSRRHWNTTDVAEAAGISVDTVRDFMAGKRWPQPATLGKLDQAFEWPPGTLAHIAQHGDAPQTTMTVGAESDTDEDILFHLPASATEGLTEMEREEIIATARAAALKALREIKGS